MEFSSYLSSIKMNPFSVDKSSFNLLVRVAYLFFKSIMFLLVSWLLLVSIIWLWCSNIPFFSSKCFILIFTLSSFLFIRSISLVWELLTASSFTITSTSSLSSITCFLYNSSYCSIWLFTLLGPLKTNRRFLGNHRNWSSMSWIQHWFASNLLPILLALSWLGFLLFFSLSVASPKKQFSSPFPLFVIL